MPDADGAAVAALRAMLMRHACQMLIFAAA